MQVKLCNRNKRVHTCAFLDRGSTDTFFTEKLMRHLNARGQRTEVLLRTMGTETVKSNELTGLEVGNVEDGTFLKLPMLYTQKKIPATKRNILTQVDLKKWPYLQEIPMKEIDADVDLLIGLNTPKALEPWRIINSQGEGPNAVRTLVGWVVNGPLNHVQQYHVLWYWWTESQGFILRSFWKNNTPMTSQRRSMRKRGRCQRMTESSCRQPAQRSIRMVITTCLYPFMIRMPSWQINTKWQNSEHYTLKENSKRIEFMQLSIKTLWMTSSWKDMLRKYHQKIILKMAKYGTYPTLRVVFDCTSPYKGTSLNKVLLQGPDLTNSLIGVLLKFRQEPDIKGMFHQVQVSKEDVNLLRFLWWPGGNTSKNLEQYRMRVQLFGAISSPTCANFALRKTAEDNRDKFDTIKSNFYVNDCLKSVASEKQTIDLVKNFREICSLGGFKLTTLG